MSPSATFSHLPKPAPANGAGELFVTVEQGSNRGATYELSDQQLTIGRHPSCAVVLTDEQVSARHAAIAQDRDGQPTVCDLGSTNGKRPGADHRGEP